MRQLNLARTFKLYTCSVVRQDKQKRTICDNEEIPSISRLLFQKIKEFKKNSTDSNNFGTSIVTRFNQAIQAQKDNSIHIYFFCQHHVWLSTVCIRDLDKLNLTMVVLLQVCSISDNDQAAQKTVAHVKSGQK